MLALATLALFLAVGLLVGGYAVARIDGIGHRRTLVVVAVLLAAGGVTAQAMPVSVTPSSESTPAAAPTPEAAAVADATGGTEVVERSEAASDASTPSDPVGNATVVAVSAPDRLTYRTESGARHTVGLAGVDAPGLDGGDPETFDGVLTSDRGRRCLADHGRRALVDLRTDLLDEQVTVRTVGTAKGTRVATVAVDGRLVNRRLVERGDARATDRRYADAERAARSAHRGVWSCGVVEPDRPLRESNTSTLRIAAVHPNPPDDATPGIGGEYLVVENTGERAVDLSDWHVVVDSTHYYFFDDRRLQPGAELVVHVGAGRDTQGHVYWAAGRPVLDDGSGTIRLVDGDTDRAVRLSY
ncbi:lamin tail domain-containing protein [Haloplanus salilacus]|uniref:lamin tail domain-containing protein n=1 Tax=Haloplanus salilacus TaxID=2949994 RepID=UPI0030CEB409